MSIVHLSSSGRGQLPSGGNRSSRPEFRFDRTANEKRPYSSRSRFTGTLGERPVRHEFAIEDLGQAGWLRPHRYRYFCIRCRWLFLIENRRGKATAVDESGRPLCEPEQSDRVASFALGPCPAALPDIVREKRRPYRKFAHPPAEPRHENAKSGSTLFRTLSIGLKTAVAKRLLRIT
jgi:hypothetical protein